MKFKKVLFQFPSNGKAHVHKGIKTYENNQN